MGLLWGCKGGVIVGDVGMGCKSGVIVGRVMGFIMGVCKGGVGV